MESGKWKVENGKWKVESGKWKVESGKLKIENEHTPPPAYLPTSLPAYLPTSLPAYLPAYPLSEAKRSVDKRSIDKRKYFSLHQRESGEWKMESGKLKIENEHTPPHTSPLAYLPTTPPTSLPAYPPSEAKRSVAKRILSEIYSLHQREAGNIPQFSTFNFQLSIFNFPLSTFHFPFSTVSLSF